MSNIVRKFPPGSKWVYCKVYTGYITADYILIKRISSIVKECREKYGVTDFFFIRYKDPEYHLRIRFLIYDGDHDNISKVMFLLCERLNPLINKDLISKILLDTYTREIERYNPALIELSETIFSIDSECVIRALRILNESGDRNYQWMFSLLLVDSFFENFDYSLKERCELLLQMANSLKNEFNFNMYNSKQFNSKYRMNKQVVENVLMRKMTAKGFSLLYKVIDKRLRDIDIIVQSIVSISQKKKINLNSIISSYIHMSLNRLFRSNNRLHELIIYDFLHRYYLSLQKRSL